jgi:hypothetical protein
MKHKIEVDIHMEMTIRGSYGYGSGGKRVQDSLYFFVMGSGGPDLSFRAQHASMLFRKNNR